MRILGILLIVLAVVSFVYEGVTYTKREKVVDLGPVEAVAATKERIPLPPLVGGAALLGGVALLVAGERKRA